MNINNEVRKHLIKFLNKVLDQNYTRNEWESFSYNTYQNHELENIRREVAKTIAENLEPYGFEMKTVSKETRESIQATILELDKISI
jgi:hypothetical protein